MSDRPRATRRTRAELKKMMLEAGREVLLDLEPTMGFERLTYSAVFEHLLRERGEKVTTGSVHERIWQSQREYQLEVLARVITDTPRQTFDVSQGGVTEALEHVDLTTIEGRRYGLQNLVRLMQNAAAATDQFGGFATREEEIAFITRNRLWEFGDGDEATESIAALIREHRRLSADLYVELMQGAMELFGVRARPGFDDPGAELVAVIGNAIALGMMTDPLPLADATLELPTGLNGELEPWHTTSIGIWAVVCAIGEFDDDSLSEAERRL